MSLQLNTGVMQYRENTDDVWKPIILMATPSNNLVINVPSFSSLPLTIQNQYVTSTHVVAQYELSNDSAQTSDWTVTTADGSFTISGTISDSTSMKLLLVTAIEN